MHSVLRVQHHLGVPSPLQPLEQTLPEVSPLRLLRENRRGQLGGVPYHHHSPDAADAGILRGSTYIGREHTNASFSRNTHDVHCFKLFMESTTLKVFLKRKVASEQDGYGGCPARLKADATHESDHTEGG